MKRITSRCGYITTLREHKQVKKARATLRTLLLDTQQLLRNLGVETAKVSLGAALSRARSKKLSIQTVIDIGASDGRWSLVAKRYFPQATYFLLEARHEHESDLQEVKQHHQTFDYAIAAAGDTEGEIYFDASHLFGGIASHTPFAQNCITVPVTTIDAQVASRRLQPPFFLKLDTHGFEIPIFEGALQTLTQTQLILVETYNFSITKDSLRFHQICDYLASKGFRCVDICDPLHRPRDHSLYQMDLLFMPSNHETFRSDSYW